MSYKYKNGDVVNYNNGVLSGKAIVHGYATTEFPVIGAMVIIEDITGNLPSKDYPYVTFTCAEVHLTATHQAVRIGRMPPLPS